MSPATELDVFFGIKTASLVKMRFWKGYTMTGLPFGGLSIDLREAGIFDYVPPHSLPELS